MAHPQVKRIVVRVCRLLRACRLGNAKHVCLFLRHAPLNAVGASTGPTSRPQSLEEGVISTSKIYQNVAYW